MGLLWDRPLPAAIVSGGRRQPPSQSGVWVLRHALRMKKLRPERGVTCPRPLSELEAGGHLDLKLQALCVASPHPARFQWFADYSTELLPDMKAAAEGAEEKRVKAQTHRPSFPGICVPSSPPPTLGTLVHAVPSSRYFFPTFFRLTNSYACFKTQSKWHLPPGALPDSPSPHGSSL